MLILSIDSTAKESSAALFRDGRLIGEINLNSGYTHSESLLPSVEFLLNSSKLSPSDVDVFAAAVGPGSFTGVRIGAATVKGLAFGRGSCCAAVSTLEALALNTSELGGISVPVMDARRGQVYTAVFDCRGDIPIRLTEDSAMSVSELGKLLAETDLGGADIYFVGDGYDIVMRELSDKVENVRATPAVMRTHSAASVAKVAQKMADKGLLVNDVSLSPCYLRLSQAEREYNEKHNTDQN